mmetsp:Transcript_45193/g.112262  ORF Transcript_45193/g.112262 Transcript_45193/m.112262 type:complete len:376 (+) Transcript_45193:2050-3177(+)
MHVVVLDAIDDPLKLRNVLLVGTELAVDREHERLDDQLEALGHRKTTTWGGGQGAEERAEPPELFLGACLEAHILLHDLDRTHSRQRVLRGVFGIPIAAPLRGKGLSLLLVSAMMVLVLLHNRMGVRKCCWHWSRCQLGEIASDGLVAGDQERLEQRLGVPEARWRQCLRRRIVGLPLLLQCQLFAQHSCRRHHHALPRGHSHTGALRHCDRRPPRHINRIHDRLLHRHGHLRRQDCLDWQHEWAAWKGANLPLGGSRLEMVSEVVECGRVGDFGATAGRRRPAAPVMEGVEVRRIAPQRGLSCHRHLMRPLLRHILRHGPRHTHWLVQPCVRPRRQSRQRPAGHIDRRLEAGERWHGRPRVSLPVMLVPFFPGR